MSIIVRHSVGENIPISRCFVFPFSLSFHLFGLHSCILDICRRANTPSCQRLSFCITSNLFVFPPIPCLVLHLHLSLHLFLVSDFSLFSSLFFGTLIMHTDTYTPYLGEERPGFQESFSIIPMLGHCFLSDLFSLYHSLRLRCDLM